MDLRPDNVVNLGGAHGRIIHKREFLHNLHPVVEVVLEKPGPQPGDAPLHMLVWCRQPVTESVTQFGRRLVRNPVIRATYGTAAGPAIMRATVDETRRHVAQTFDAYWANPQTVDLRTEEKT